MSDKLMREKNEKSCASQNMTVYIACLLGQQPQIEMRFDQRSAAFRESITETACYWIS
jgi:hypothetical protein